MLFQLINLFYGSDSKDIQFLCYGRYVLFLLSQPNDCIIQFICKHFKCFGTSIPSYLIGYEMFHVDANGIESNRNESNQCVFHSRIITIDAR